jgi:hypothetical protein
MSYLSTLLDNNVPFEFNGSSIHIQTENMKHLTDNKIPFTFKDGGIVLSENILTKTDITMDSFMQTIIRCLSNSGKFMRIDVSGNPNAIENECKTVVKLQYDRYVFCTIKLHANKMMLFYHYGVTIISLTESFEKLNSLLPEIIDGFVLMIIAGFTHKITVLRLKELEFECRGLYKKYDGLNINHCVSDVKFDVDFLDGWFIVSKNKRKHLSTNDLNDTINFIKNF